MPKITQAEVRMYTMGTGDCFAIKFFAGSEEVFKLMIDAGTWSGSGEKLAGYIRDLKDYVNNYVDVLIVTHEHKDHVHAFDVCEELFTGEDFAVGEIWLAWTENDAPGKTADWKEQYGEKKKTLGLAALRLREAMETPGFKEQLSGNRDFEKALGARKVFREVLDGFADLHMAFDDHLKTYKGGLRGMEVVKHKIKNREIKYFKPGDIIQDLGDTEGMKIYVLGPPEFYEDVKKEAGGEGESYDHNKDLHESGAFGAAILNMQNNTTGGGDLLPFDDHYLEAMENTRGLYKTDIEIKEENEMKNIKSIYDQEDWRKIDFDWLYSAGSFALRMNGLTNNLSLAIAIEIADKDNDQDKGKVLLFPGDAEFGSWASWHRIPWNVERSNSDENEKKKNFTEDLLNRTVFYKVAHHLSHNGTAQRLGLEMMNHKDLAAMATLDYDTINSGWTSTMPNREIVKELLSRTKGRLMIMNEHNLFFDFNEKVPLKEKITEARSRMSAKERALFENNLKQTPFYIEYKIIF